MNVLCIEHERNDAKWRIVRMAGGESVVRRNIDLTESTPYLLPGALCEGLAVGFATMIQMAVVQPTFKS